MIKLGVNIDHVATLREARYHGFPHGEPDPVAAALICESAGAHGITAHLREDRRHIQDRDVSELRASIATRLNLEMANTQTIIDVALRIKPHIVCLVPEHRKEITTEGGLDVVAHLEALAETVRVLTEAGIDVSLFINPDPPQIEAAAATRAQFVELHTGGFAQLWIDPQHRAAALDQLARAADVAHQLGLRVNAGHGLNYDNVPHLLEHVPHLVELNIGHSIVSRAITTGLHAAVREMLELLAPYPNTKTQTATVPPGL
jgi:pyridoxine 5-phosphate synthase